MDSERLSPLESKVVVCYRRLAPERQAHYFNLITNGATDSLPDVVAALFDETEQPTIPSVRAVNQDYLDSIKRGDPHNQVSLHFYTEAMWQKALEYFDHRCAYCGASEGLLRSFQFVREHYIPTSSPGCPGAVPWNIVPACGRCNNRKRNDNAERWLVAEFGSRRALHIITNIDRYFATVRAARASKAG